jgi:hypothetical protein
MGSTMETMDAYQLFQRYSESSTWLPEPEDYDQNDEKVYGLVLKMIEERPEKYSQCSVSQLTEQLLGLSEKESDESKYELTDPDTVQLESQDDLTETATVEAVPGQVLTDIPQNENKFYSCAQARILTDTIMANNSARRLTALATALDVRVDMQWVYTFASTVINPMAPEKYRTLRGTDSHVHIISSSVIHFMSQLEMAPPPPKITTFVWGPYAKKAIHIQNLRKKIRKLFPDVTASVAVMFLGSVGLPMHELFKSKDFIENFIRARFKKLNNETIIQTTLRKMIKINKITPKTEAAQLLEEYATKEELFETIKPVNSVEQYMFKHWYAYPRHDELNDILRIASGLLDVWRAGKKVTNRSD